MKGDITIAVVNRFIANVREHITRGVPPVKAMMVERENIIRDRDKAKTAFKYYGRADYPPDSDLRGARRRR